MKFHFDVIAPIYDYIIPKPEYQVIEPYLPLNGSEVVLEIGGGTGRLADELSERGKIVYALDPSLSMLRFIKKKGKKNLKPIYGYAENLPFDDDFFDVIIVHDSLHHWDEQVRGLLETFRVLKPGGSLFIGEIHPNDKYGHFIVCMEKSLFMGSQFFLPGELKEILEEIGFRVQRWGWIGKPTYFIVAKKEGVNEKYRKKDLHGRG